MTRSRDTANIVDIPTAKGDIYTATAANTPAKLAVGSDGSILVANSAASTGLGWAGNQAAGKNFLINGAMEYAQRGTTTNQGGVYSLDRWYISSSGSTPNSVIAQGTTTPPTGFRYYLKATQSSSTSTNIFISQSLETTDVLKFAGQTVTLSFYYRIPTSYTNTWSINTFYSTSIDAKASYTTGATNITSVALSNTSSWTRYVSPPISVPSNATSFGVEFINTNNTVSTAEFNMTGIQLELGSVATPFTRAGGTIQGELAAAQRYYWRATATNFNQGWSMGQCYSTTQAFGVIPFPVQMRTVPTALEQNGTAGDYKLTTSNFGGAVCTSVPTFNAATTLSSTVVFTVGSGLTAGNATSLQSGQATGYLGWSAEL